MTRDDPFHFDYARHWAATALRPEHIVDFQRLVKTLRHGSRFQLLFAEFTEADYRDTLIRRLDLVFADLGQPVARIDLSSQGFADFAALEVELRQLATDHGAIHLIGVDGWFDEGCWRDFNTRREAIAFGVPVRLVIWLSAETMARAIILAPDLWAWRGGVYAFTTLPVSSRESLQPHADLIDPRTLAERCRRIAVLRESLSAEPPLDDEILGLLWDELAGLLASIGELDEALRIRREEQLPVYERLGDMRERAVTLAKIASILQVRGELDEALRICRKDVLPAFEQLRDVRSRAVTLGQIADVLQARGELDEALRIYQKEQLPAFEQLGDVRERTVALGKIAGILQARGELNEALRIYQEEELPTYERLGDVWLRAVTLGKIADVLQARGELDEALRIRQEEELPVYERFQSTRDLLGCRAKIGINYLMCGATGDREKALGFLRLALQDAQRLQLPEAQQIAGIIQRHTDTGDLGELT